MIFCGVGKYIILGVGGGHIFLGIWGVKKIQVHKNVSASRGALPSHPLYSYIFSFYSFALGDRVSISLTGPGVHHTYSLVVS